MMYFDLRDDDSVVIEISSLELTIRLLNGHSMPQLVTEISTITGTMSPLPKWTQEGAIIGLEGGTKEVQKVRKGFLYYYMAYILAHLFDPSLRLSRN